MIDVNEIVEFDLSLFPNKINGLRAIEPTSVSGKLFYDINSDRVVSDLLVDTTCIVGCAITNEDVDVDCSFVFDEVFSFSPSENDEIVVVKHETIDLGQAIFQSILSQIPTKVVKKGQISYPKGDGWEVLSASDYDKREKPVDPRLAKLKELLK